MSGSISPSASMTSVSIESLHKEGPLTSSSSSSSSSEAPPIPFHIDRFVFHQEGFDEKYGYHKAEGSWKDGKYCESPFSSESRPAEGFNCLSGCFRRYQYRNLKSNLPLPNRTLPMIFKMLIRHVARPFSDDVLWCDVPDKEHVVRCHRRSAPCFRKQ